MSLKSDSATSVRGSILTAALHFLKRFFAVLPIIANKKFPAVANGFKDASTDPDQIVEWFPKNTHANIGIATGVASSIFVLDIDVKDGVSGMESLAELENKYGPLPPTLTCATGSGGKHFYFNYPQDTPIKCRVAIRPGIDVRGEGGYVVAPPSIVSGNLYQWIDESVPIADAPAWLIKIVGVKKPREPKLTETPTIGTVVTPGSRNDTMMQAVTEQMKKGHPRNVVTDIVLMLNAAACVPPLEDAEVLKIVDNVFRLYSDQGTMHCTDSGNAKKMASLYKNEVRYVVDTGQWLQWNENIWSPTNKNAIYALAKGVCKTLHAEADALIDGPLKKALKLHALDSENRRKLDDMIKLFESENPIAVPISTLDQHGYIFPVKNGVVDLKTGQFSPPDRNLLLTHGTNVEYDVNATCPQWEKFLLQIMDNDKDLVLYLQRAIGYSLTTSTQEQCLFFLYGFGANGKSTFLNVLRALMSELGTQAAGETLLDGKRSSSGPSGDIARLRGKRFVALSEVDDGKFLAEALVKSLTGSDAITARHLYKDDFVFIPVFKLWLAANHKPTIKGDGHAIWRRIHLIPFNVRFEKAQQDIHLEQKLIQELPGILNWAVRGCLDWQKNRLPIPVAIQKATSEYRSEMDILGLWISEHCEMDETYELRFDDAYELFEPWGVTNFKCNYSKIKFGKMLTERGFTKVTRPHRCYVGLALRKTLPKHLLKKHDAHKDFVQLVETICAVQWHPDDAACAEQSGPELAICFDLLDEEEKLADQVNDEEQFLIVEDWAAQEPSFEQWKPEDEIDAQEWGDEGKIDPELD
ncbi:phage/plasmid primase, P4 family [Collimonas silvisoli]|uniref:phage/plasmid primase, P4 family n=1 Tax=Collimonas silvisoli TaxID=2825884 RepID=UPI001B8B6255|nr:phage/plasmid primase, P4 family [Collimonas silvisoli]